METLYLDHIDNAVMDAWYRSCRKGTRIGYNLWKLPGQGDQGILYGDQPKGGTGLIPEE